MNIQKILFSTLAAAMALSAVSTANAAAIDGNASATVVTAITLNEDRGMDFGTFTVGGAGTVTLSSAASTTRGFTGSIGLLGTSEASGQFTITGTPLTSVTIDITDGATNLTLGATTIDFAPNTTPSLGTPYTLTGTDVLYVGGVITLLGTETAGVYSSNTAYTVTVNYE